MSEKKKALIVASVAAFLDSFEVSDIGLLRDRGYEVHCACNLGADSNQSASNPNERLAASGAVLHQVDFARSPLSRTNGAAYRQLLSLMRREGFTLVHCHTPVAGMLARLAARKAKVPLVLYTAHGFHFFRGAPKKNWLLFYPLEQAMSRVTDVLVTINEEDYRRAEEKSHARRVFRVHGVGVDTARFSACRVDRMKKRAELGVGEGEKLLLSVGDLDDEKHHITVLRAMETLAPKGYRYFIAGDGERMESHRAFIRDHHLEHAVTLLGYRHDIPELLRAADLYIFPSLREGLPVALMEAVAAEKPVACSPIRGNVDIVVTPESYFDPESPEAAAEAVERILSLSPEERERMIRANQENLKRYDISRVRQEMTAVYQAAEELLEQKSR